VFFQGGDPYAYKSPQDARPKTPNPNWSPGRGVMGGIAGRESPTRAQSGRVHTTTGLSDDDLKYVGGRFSSRGVPDEELRYDITRDLNDIRNIASELRITSYPNPNYMISGMRIEGLTESYRRQ